MIGEPLYTPIKTFLNKIAEGLNRCGVKPLQLTIIGVIFNAVAAWFYAYGYFVIGSLVVLFASIFDMLDGPLARCSGKVTKFGAFIDSVADRYSDSLIFGGLLVYFARFGQLNYVILVLVVIAGALLTSYTKARAENLIDNCSVGWFGRPERIFIIFVGGVSGLMIPALWILAVMTHITALQRIMFTWNNTTTDRASKVVVDQVKGAQEH